VPIDRRASQRLLAAVILAAVAGACSDDTDGGDAAAGDAGAVEPVVADEEGAAVFTGIPALVDEVQPSVVAVVTDVGEGSGVIYDDDGAIVTNAHVVAGAATVDVTFADGSRSDGEVVAADPSVDLAVIRTARDDLEAADFSDSSPRVGELALAIGNPFGFENTVTAGIISGLERSVPGGGTALVGLLQTDAAISPGNSGGALVGATGEVIGVNVAYIPPAGGAVAIGFAIPSVVVVDVAEEMLDDGQAEHAFLGITPAALTPQLAEQYGIGAESGVLVLEVLPGSPADEAGISTSDVIVAVDDEQVAEPGDLLAELRTRDPGDTIELTVLRGGDEESVDVELGQAPQVPG
jgi:serine protease DegQ